MPNVNFTQLKQNFLLNETAVTFGPEERARPKPKQDRQKKPERKTKTTQVRNKEKNCHFFPPRFLVDFPVDFLVDNGSGEQGTKA